MQVHELIAAEGNQQDAEQVVQLELLLVGDQAGQEDGREQERPQPRKFGDVEGGRTERIFLSG